MLPTPHNFAVCPSVVPAGKVSHMTITADERIFIPFTDAEYQLKILAVNGDETDNYGDPVTHSHLTLTGKDGALHTRTAFADGDRFQYKPSCRLFGIRKRMLAIPLIKMDRGELAALVVAMFRNVVMSIAKRKKSR